MNDWFKFIFKETIINLNNIPGVIFKDIEIGDVNVDNTSQKIDANDGVIPGSNTFSPFTLKATFYYDGVDESDLFLM